MAGCSGCPYRLFIQGAQAVHTAAETGCLGCSHSLNGRVLRLFTQPQWQGAQVVHIASVSGCSGYSHSLNGRVLRLFTQPQRQGAQVVHTASETGCSGYSHSLNGRVLIIHRFLLLSSYISYTFYTKNGFAIL